jgi:hypothetical protein
VIDPAHYTGWWREVGACYVIIMGEGALRVQDARGADLWLKGTAAAQCLVHVVLDYCSQSIAAAAADAVALSAH